jgi:hypothetical protein
MPTILLLSLAGTILAMVIGTIWYWPTTPTGRLHMRYLGFDKLSEEEKKRKMAESAPTMWKYYLGQAILSFLTSFAVVFIVTMTVQNGVPFTMAVGFVLMNWLTFMVPVVGSSILWSNCDKSIAWPKLFSDAGANLVTVLLIAFMTSLFI